MGRPFRLAGDTFEHLHRFLESSPPLTGSLEVPDHCEPFRELARDTWEHRAQAEFREVQVLSRFLVDVTSAGDPLDIYLAVARDIEAATRQCALSMRVCEALGGRPELPRPVDLEHRHIASEAPVVERALYTALTALAINGALSVAFIHDLRERCCQTAIKSVLDAAMSHEPQRMALRWAYVRMSLERFPAEALDHWRAVTRWVLEEQRQSMSGELGDIDPALRRLGDWADEGRIELGLFSAARQALVFEQTLREVVEPRLAKLGLL